MLDFSLYNTLLILTFVLGYFLITIEHVIKVNKTSTALLMAIICWIIQFTAKHEGHADNLSYLSEHMANISQVVFFLLGALTIVEIINAHKGFKLISDFIRIRSKRRFLWLIGLITFFLSSVLDNLTTTIIMVTLLRRLVSNDKDRLLIGGAIVVAANAGGAWTPIGDVTTTMLWIGGQLSTFNVIKVLFWPSFVCLVVSLACISFFLKGEEEELKTSEEKDALEPMGHLIFWLGLGCLIFVPFFKFLTGLPPFMGIIFGLGVMWLITDIVHTRYEHRLHLTVPHIMTRIDVGSVLFFLGILLAVDALHTAGLLDLLATYMSTAIPNSNLIAIAIGLASAVVDNVPLVAATMGMYETSQFPIDSPFWNLIAYCAGTGGSILVIGSAAGVAFMGLEKVNFLWYAKRIGIPAVIGYFAGIVTYFLTYSLFL